MTTPDAYPLTLNALRLACGQKSNRDPVVEMTDRDVLRALDGLVEHRLAYQVSAAGSRVPKYAHRADDQLGLEPPALAVLAELMLRGPQTPGELRARAGRMSPLATVAEVTAVLDPLTVYEPAPLATQLPRQPGRKECRFAHLLGGPPTVADGEVTPPRSEPARVALHAEDERVERLAAEVAALRAELAELRASFAGFRAQFE